jgi:hypothetical protein
MKEVKQQPISASEIAIWHFGNLRDEQTPKIDFIISTLIQLSLFSFLQSLIHDNQTHRPQFSVPIFHFTLHNTN